MIDKNIKEYCQLIVEINEINDFLDQAKRGFYDGGTPFEVCYSMEIVELEEKQEKLKQLIKLIIS